MAGRLPFMFMVLTSICSISVAKADAWTPEQDPVSIGKTLSSDINKLSVSRQSPMGGPIQEDLWPATLDGIKWRSTVVTGYRILKIESVPQEQRFKFKKRGAKGDRFVILAMEVSYGDLSISTQYVLYIDAKGQVKGGKWTADNQDDAGSEHPDFIWTPGTLKKLNFVRGLEYGRIRDLLDQALDDNADQVSDFN